MVPSFLFQ